MSITATAKPAPEQLATGSYYRCKRCGIVKRGGAVPVEFCDDCRDDAVALGWAPPRKTWSRRKELATERHP